ncbi:hypothetical protein A0H81_08431 [Grifola frondosa]|uniref:Phosphatidate cytidylyltransferase, mitochondrial n=1 Tax=Grifola frondosa TaxID=5627 RepID=A0A1C7M864_GRIFR|nr:hypothetical protein A0H81_08431 [Grifola frondosa]
MAIAPRSRSANLSRLEWSFPAVAYGIFKRFEPTRITVHILLLLVPPPLFATIYLSHYYSPFCALAVAYATYLSTLVSSVLLYRVSPFHPLAQYPGPFLCKLSKLWMAWVASYGGKQFIYIDQLHKQYGDAVRIGPNEVSFRSTSAIIPIMGPNGLPKGPHWAGRNMKDSAKQLVCVTDIHEHARRRKPWNRAFSVPALKGYEEIIVRRVEQLVETLASQPSEANLGKWLSWFAYDLMSDMAFNGGSEMMREGDKDSVWHLIEDGLVASQAMGHCPWLGIYVGHIPLAAYYMKQLLDFGDERATARIKNGSHSKDLFYYLNNEDGAENAPPPVEQVTIDGALAIVAGSDTTSCVLSNLFYCILSHPDVYKRLQAEVDAYFPPGENALNTTNHADMPFLNAVINETMRVFPPLPSGSQRTTTRETGGRAIGPYYLPPGTAVSVHFYSLHRDPRNFAPFPDSFWPDRWLIAAGQKELKDFKIETFVHNTAAFVPFSYGPANCVGKGLALQEMRMVVCLLMQKLEMRFRDGWDPKLYEESIREYLVMTKPLLPVLIERRHALLTPYLMSISNSFIGRSLALHRNVTPSSSHLPPPPPPGRPSTSKPIARIRLNPAPRPITVQRHQVLASLPPSFGRNQFLPVADSTRTLLEAIVARFDAPIRYAFAYGSGVFEQDGYLSSNPTSKDGPMLDFLFAVTHASHWHSINMHQFPGHYPLHARMLGSSFVSRVEDISPGVWFNTHVQMNGVVGTYAYLTPLMLTIDTQTIKYGVTTVDNLCSDLLNWRTLYLAGRMHKPLRIIKDDARVRLTQQVNLTSAVRTALLTLPAEFSETQLFERIAGFSYGGDLRMMLPAENRGKVGNIVRKQGSQFKELYHRLVVALPGVHWPAYSSTIQQDTSAHARAAHLKKLPSNLLKGVTEHYDASTSIPRAKRTRACTGRGWRETRRCRRCWMNVSLDASVCVRCRVLIVYSAALHQIVRYPSTVQTLKGLVSAGPAKSIRYGAEKISKWYKGSSVKP